MNVEVMPMELGVLAALAVLAASLWIPYIIGVNGDPAASPDNFKRPGDLSKLRPWVHRAHRAHLNLLEQLLPFAVLVLILDKVNGFSTLTYWTALGFLLLRIAHALGMISGVARMPLRPMLFTGGWICCLLMAYAVFRAA